MEPCKNGGFELSLQDGLGAFKAAVWPVTVTECRVVVTKNKAWTLFQHHWDRRSLILPTWRWRKEAGHMISVCIKGRVLFEKLCWLRTRWTPFWDRALNLCPPLKWWLKYGFGIFGCRRFSCAHSASSELVPFLSQLPCCHMSFGILFPKDSFHLKPNWPHVSHLSLAVLAPLLVHLNQPPLPFSARSSILKASSASLAFGL